MRADWSVLLFFFDRVVHRICTAIAEFSFLDANSQSIDGVNDGGFFRRSYMDAFRREYVGSHKFKFIAVFFSSACS